MAAAIKILVVGQGRAKQSFLDSLLRRRSVVVYRVETPEIAVVRAREIQPHVILLHRVEDSLALLEAVRPATATIDLPQRMQTMAITLSKREKETLISIANGASTKEVAERLSISPRTVEAYRNTLKRKLGLKGAADIARYAVAHKLLPG